MPLPGEELDVVRVVELSDDGVGTCALCPIDHSLDAGLVADGEGEPAEAPGLSGVMGVTCYTQQKPPGVGLGEIRQKDDTCHSGKFLLDKDSFFCRNDTVRPAFFVRNFLRFGALRCNVCGK